MSPTSIDLVKLFQKASATVGKSRESLNQSDEYNHDHGDNMVKIFEVITEAVKAKKGAEPADQLAYAAQLLRQRSQSGSAQLYTQGLSQAAQQFQGKAITADNAMQLIQSLLGGGQAAQAPTANAGGDLLGSLLGGLSGAAGDQAGDDGIDAGDLLNAGMAFLDAKQRGGNTVGALISAAMSGSQLNQSPYRSQSGQMVANALLQAVTAMSKK